MIGRDGIRVFRTAALLLVAGLAIAGCADSRDLTSVAGPVALANRQVDVDTSRLIEKFRRNEGGGVFIKLTGEPTSAALAALVSAGLRGRGGSLAPITFDSLKIATVAGYVSAGAVKALAALPWVERIESSQDIDAIHASSTYPAVNSNAFDIRWNLEMMRMPDVWRVFDAAGQRQTGPQNWQSVIISILDIGGDYRLSYNGANWQFFLGYSAGNYTNDPTEVYLGQHGTDVASFAVGEPDGLWGAGVAPRAYVEFFKVLPDDDWIPLVSGLNAAYSAGNSVVNMSLGNCGAVPPSTVAAAIAQFGNTYPSDAGYQGIGINLVAAAGNGLADGCSTTAVQYPAAYPEVIAVAAVDAFGTRGSHQDFSSGSKIELSAPGICVDGLLVGGGNHPCVTGTSVATPHVAGAIAVLRAKNPTWSANYVRSLLQSTASPVAGQTLPRDVNFGYGVVNPYDALSNVAVTVTGTSTVKTANNYGWTCSASGGSGGGFTYTWERSDAGGAYYVTGTGTTYAAWTDQTNAPYFDLKCTATTGNEETGSKVKRVNVIIP
jgi:hypothetical protein